MADVLNEALIQAKSDYALGLAPSSPAPTLILFVTNVTVTCTTVIGDLTECTAPGYARVTLTPADWTGGFTACVLTYTYPTFNITFTGPGAPGQTVFGHAVIDANTNDVWWGITYATPFVIPAAGGEIVFNLTWQDKQCS